jgi:16S rRNA (cytidine1402-2'-O)-methyltransferase
VLYLVATPIGNLGDITFRAIETLKSCDYILCEDTRHSVQLLSHFEIRKPLKSFHKFNESEKEDQIIQHLKSGQKIAVISDAGTPGISDPGSQLVQRCVNEGIEVIAIPGACAAITALTTSGFNTERFQFFGFLPKKSSELKSVLRDLLTYSGTTICYESPHRLLSLLEILQELAPSRKMAVARELTKKFEEICRGTPAELAEKWKDREVKGEIVFLISGEDNSKIHDWEKLTPAEHVAMLEETYQISRNEAIKLAAATRGVPKRHVYNTLHADQEAP